jgi:aryl-alcohol dehydrogenase-like predicted oxidoreductase
LLVVGTVLCVNYRKLGSSGIEVSEVSLGSWLTYSGGVAREQAEACVKTAFEEGINFIDTANVYGRVAARRCAVGV